VEEAVGLEVDAGVVDVGGSSAAAEKDEVAWLEVLTADVGAVLLVLFAAVALQADAIDVAVDVGGESGAIGACAGGASEAVGCAYPAGALEIEGVWVVLLDVETEYDAGADKLSKVGIGIACAVA
jgi:hypothetical protein